MQMQEREKNIEEAIGYFLEEELVAEIKKIAQIRSVEKGEVIVTPGESLPFIPIVISGSLKISRENEDGEELLMYYIEGGDSCAMSMQCCVRKVASEVKATVVEDGELLMIPTDFIENWLDRYKSWRNYVLQSYHTRMIELMETIDEIAFKRLDERLIKYLKDQAKLQGSLEIKHTHQQIAEDLHSSRVVISRLLKQLEVKKEIQIKRGAIVIASL